MATKTITLDRAGVWENANGSGREIPGLKSMKISIKSPSRVIGAPVESGQTSFDNKVLDPTQVVVSGFVVVDSTYKETMDRLQKMYVTRDWKFYYVSDGAESAGNLVLKDFNTTRDTDKYDFVGVELVFVEAMFMSSEDKKPSNSEDGDCRNHGYSQGVSF